MLSEKVCSDRSDQCRKTSEDHVPNDCSSQQIGQQTTYIQTGDGRGGEKGEDRQCFRESELDGSEGDGSDQHGQDHIGGGDGRTVNEVKRRFLHECILLSFVLGEDGYELTAKTDKPFLTLGSIA